MREKALELLQKAVLWKNYDHVSNLYIKLLQKESTQKHSSVKNETYFHERKSYCFSAGSNQLSPNMIPKALLGTLLEQKQ